jgi:hypothetical protein
VIVVVEGPSGAGKTTWCQKHGGTYALLEELPDHATVPAEPLAAARFWVERNVARWREVVEREARDGLVVVDTDPFKLHYVWSLWRTGRATTIEWELQRDAAREAFASGRYALADVFLVSDIDDATLRARRDADPSRPRRNFEHHVRLRDALLRWYGAIERIEPGRVLFGLPEDGVTPGLTAKGKRTRRSGPELFDELMRALPAA